MHKFDIKYKLEDYYEYYKFIMFRQRLIRESLFFFIFVGIGVYWLAAKQEGLFIPIFSFCMAVLVPMMTLLYVPLIKRQLSKRQDEIDRTHIVVSFDENEVVYENQTAPVEKPISEPVVEKEKKEEDNQSEDTTPVDNNKKEEQQPEQPKEENIFRLKYENFLSVKETKGLLLFYLDRQTVVIIPKTTYCQGDDLSEFKMFILSHINPRRVRFKK